MVKIAWLLAAALVLTEPVASCDTDDDGTSLLQLQRKDKERDDREELDCLGPKPCIKRVTTVAPTTPTPATTAAPTTTEAAEAPANNAPAVGAYKAQKAKQTNKAKRTKRPQWLKRLKPAIGRLATQVKPGKCKLSRGETDCTNKDIFEFLGNVSDKYQEPTYSADEYGEDKWWKTFDSALPQTKGSPAEKGWSGSCMAYVRTGGGTCKDWCKKQKMTCVKAMDDAHHQTAKLTEWLTTKGYTKNTFGAGSKTQPGCTILPEGHKRQSEEDNGCKQRWGTQMCACK